jgi:hypothetical protein
MTTAASTRWSLRGTVLIMCNCDWGCPCNFNALPTAGYCEGGWTWHVEQGRYGDVALDGLNFSILVKWPGAIHHGNGEGIIYVDERADAQQREAIATLVKGGVGGPWGILGWTWPKVHGPKPMPYDLVLGGVHSRLKVGDALVFESTTIKNPVNGHEAHPGVVLPEGLIVKRADLGASKTYCLTDDISFDHSGKYTAIGPFDYAGP